MKVETVYEAMGKMGRCTDAVLWLTGYQSAVKRFVQALHTETRGQLQSVLDVGCGTGAFTLEILRQFPDAHVWACDRDGAMLDRLEKKVNRRQWGNRVDLLESDIRKPIHRIRGKTFEAIITAGVLEHLDVESALPILSAYLEDGGHILNSSVRDTWIGRTVGKFYGGFKPYERRELQEAFEIQGFHLRESISMPPFIPASYKGAEIYRKNGNHHSV